MNLYTIFIVLISCQMSYLMGSIPFGLLLGKLFGAGDIRNIGSGNIGATNMLRTGRKGLAAATLVLDFLKGILGIAVAQGICSYFLSLHATETPACLIYLAGIAAVLGHIYPVWLGFKGGKGVATTLGVLVAIQPMIGFLTILGWLFLFYLTRVSSLAAIGSIAGAPILGYMYASTAYAAMALFLAILVIYKHKDNIIRLRQGSETKWEKKDDPT